MDETFWVTIRYQEPIARLISFRPEFGPMRTKVVPSDEASAWLREGKLGHDLSVLFFGKTGYGKSSTINRLTGSEALETSDTEPCTRRCQCVDYRMGRRNTLSFGDLPGIGDTRELDEGYWLSYRRFLEKAAVVVYVLRADQRDYREDLILWQELGLAADPRVVIGLNQADKIAPRPSGRTTRLGSVQLENLERKVSSVARAFGVDVAQVVPYSAKTGWQLSALATAITGAIPSQ